MSRVSVLFPCRDAAPYLADAIRSIEAQTYTTFEVIAVNDGSTDGTGRALDDWAARDPRVRVLHTAPHGLVPALQSALACATGAIIARMDADDVAHPERLARQVQLLDTDAATDVCGARIRYVPRSSVRDGARRYERWINSLTDHDRIVRDMFVECPIPHPTLTVRRSVLDDVGGYRDAGWPEDYDLILRLWSAGCRFSKVAEVLLDWRERPDRLSRTDARYGATAFRRCKAHWLQRSLLQNRDGAVVWGAGPIGKSMARELAAIGVRIRAFVDLDPRKIGQQVHGAPVVAPVGINRFRGAFALAAVGSAGVRDEIRRDLDAAGWVEMVDYCAVA